MRAGGKMMKHTMYMDSVERGERSTTLNDQLLGVSLKVRIFL